MAERETPPGKAVLPIMAYGLRHLPARWPRTSGLGFFCKMQKSQSAFEPFASGHKVKVQYGFDRRCDESCPAQHWFRQPIETAVQKQCLLLSH